MTIKFNAYRSPWSGQVEIGIANTHGKRIGVATNITFSEVDPGCITEPVLKLSQSEAQELADALYSSGIRPSLAAGSAGQLDAVHAHLQDMRRLVFKEGGAA